MQGANLAADLDVTLRLLALLDLDDFTDVEPDTMRPASATCPRG